MACEKQTVSSNLTFLSVAEEECIRELPVTPVWRIVDLNSYPEFSAALTMVAREPITDDRQNRKGTITDQEASCGFSLDFTQNNTTRFLQGAFYADMREVPTTMPLNSAGVVITGVTTGPNTYTAASGLAILTVGSMIRAEGFSVPSNNGLKRVTTAAAGVTTVAETLATEAAPPATAKLTKVGFQFASADVSMTYSGGIATLVSAASAFGALGVIPGQMIIIGGDAANTFFSTTNRGLARVRSISTSQIVLDDCNFTPAVAAGTGQTIQIFISSLLQNETGALIKRRTYQFERQLGKTATGATNQAQYMTGAVFNEFTLNLPGQDKITADCSFVACEEELRTGETGDELKSGTRVAAFDEQAFNTSNDVMFIKLAKYSDLSSVQAPLYAYIVDATLTISNNVEALKALGILGAFEMNEGNFVVTASMNAYFKNVLANIAIKNNEDMSFTYAVAAKVGNYGFVFDIPLMQVTADITVEKDQAVTVPVEATAAKSRFGTSLTYNKFSWIPTYANAA